MNLTTPKKQTQPFLNLPTHPYISKSLSASIGNTCFIAHDKNKLQCWGENTHNINNTPKLTNVQYVTAGPMHACAIRVTEDQKRRAVCWGFNVKGGMDIDDDKVQEEITIGLGITCAIYQNQQVEGENVNWVGERISEIYYRRIIHYGQDNNYEQNNYSDPENNYDLKDQNLNFECYGSSVEDKKSIIFPNHIRQDVRIAKFGLTHILIQNKKLQCMGTNKQGECDIPKILDFQNQKNNLNNRNKSSSSPMPTPNLILSASAGNHHSCALCSSSFQVSCWGSNQFRQAEDSHSWFRPLVQAVESGYDHNCVLLVNAVHCWGHNQSNQGNGTYLLHDLAELATGGWHNCVLNAAGRVYCWGYNKHMQCSIPKGVKVMQLG